MSSNEQRTPTLKEQIEGPQEMSDSTKAALRRASIKLDKILKLNPTVSTAQADEEDKEEKKVKARKTRRKSLSEMCKDEGTGGLTNDYWDRLRLQLDDEEETASPTKKKDESTKDASEIPDSSTIKVVEKSL